MRLPGAAFPGDLLIQIEEIRHPLLERDGNNLLYEHFISFVDAALGTHCRSAHGRRTGKGKNRTRNPGRQGPAAEDKGLPSINGYEGKGDLLVTIQVWTPKTLTKEEKAILEKLGKSPNFKPSPTDKDKGFFSRVKEYFDQD